MRDVLLGLYTILYCLSYSVNPNLKIECEKVSHIETGTSDCKKTSIFNLWFLSHFCMNFIQQK